eukprot:968831_1
MDSFIYDHPLLLSISKAKVNDNESHIKEFISRIKNQLMHSNEDVFIPIMSFKHSFPTHNLWSIIKQIALLQMKQHSEILHKLNAICDILQCLLSTNNGNISCVFDLALVFERKSHILKSFQIDGEYFDSKHIFNGCMKTIHNALKTLQFDADEIQQITDILMAISNLSFIQFTSQSNVEHIDENNRFLWLNACKSLGNISIDALFDLFKSNDV